MKGEAVGGKGFVDGRMGTALAETSFCLLTLSLPQLSWLNLRGKVMQC